MTEPEPSEEAALRIVGLVVYRKSSGSVKITNESLPKCAEAHAFGQNCREDEKDWRRLPERAPNNKRPDANRRTGYIMARPDESEETLP